MGFKKISIPYSLYYSPDSIRVLSRIQSRKLKLLCSKKSQKLEYNPARTVIQTIRYVHQDHKLSLIRQNVFDKKSTLHMPYYIK